MKYVIEVEPNEKTLKEKLEKLILQKKEEKEKEKTK